MDREGFTEWLRGELRRKNMAQADLARNSGISASQIAKIINMKSEPSTETLVAIAHGLQLPIELVMQKAAIFSAAMPADARIAPLATELVTIYNKLPESDRDILLTLARYLYARQT